MRTIRFLLLLVLPLLLAAPASAQTKIRTGKAKPVKKDLIIAQPAKARTEGYYKDIFMDGGIGLNAYPDLPAADFLGLTLEQYSSSERTQLISGFKLFFQFFRQERRQLSRHLRRRLHLRQRRGPRHGLRGPRRLSGHLARLDSRHRP